MNTSRTHVRRSLGLEYGGTGKWSGFFTTDDAGSSDKDAGSFDDDAGSFDDDAGSFDDDASSFDDDACTGTVPRIAASFVAVVLELDRCFNYHRACTQDIYDSLDESLQLGDDIFIWKHAFVLKKLSNIMNRVQFTSRVEEIIMTYSCSIF